MEALTTLAAAYETGEWVAKDQTKAFELFKRAAERGHPEAQRRVGLYLLRGLGGIASNPDQGIAWIERSARKGHAASQYTLGYLYETGEGVARDATQALKWYQRAAEAGFAEAQYSLGLLYAWGDGVKRNLETALTWLAKSGLNGHEHAEQAICEMFGGAQDWPDHPAPLAEFEAAIRERGRAPCAPRI